MLLVLLMLGCRPQPTAWERIQNSGVLRFGLDPTYPPFELDDGQELSGLDVDLAAAIAEELGLEPEYTYFGYDGLYDALATEQVDVLISALVIIPERMRDFAYSSGYFDAGEILVVPQETTDIATMADLYGRVVAVELGSQGHVESTNWERRISDLEIQPHDSPEAALESVIMARADAALVDAVSGRLYLMSHRQLKRVAQPVTSEPYALVVRIEDRRLLQMLNDRLLQLSQSGDLETIVRRWLGE